jgi:aryl-alcohol dehydrogenase
MPAIAARAAVLNAFHAPLNIESLTVEPPRADEVRVRLVATGICHTDLVMAAGALRAAPPVVLGHEGAGVIEDVGAEVTTHQVGDHVVLSFAHCGNCTACRAGAPAYCREFVARNFSCARPDGSCAISADHPVRGHFFGQSSFASYTVCRYNSAVLVPKDLPLELLAPLGCGVQTGAGAVINVFKAQPGATIAIFGAGAVGLSAIMAARAVGATVIIAVDRNPRRLELAMELGATHSVPVTDQDSLERLRDLAPGGVHFSLDTTGAAEVINAAIAVLASRGTCGLVSGGPGVAATVPVNALFVGGQTIRGIMEGDSVPSTFIPQLIDLYRQGRFPFDRLIKYFTLSEVNVAMAESARGEVLKPVIRF